MRAAVDKAREPTLRRVDPGEIRDFLESVGVGGSPSPQAPTQPPESGTVLDPNAVAPNGKLARLLAKNQQFKRTWERKRDKELSSQSEYDMALASFARRAGWSDQEIINLLVQHRRDGGDTEKISRLDYYVTTLAKVARTGPDKPSVTARAQVLPADGRTEFNLTDAGNAERLVSLHGSDMLCLAESWHLWDEKRFRQDDLRALDAFAIHTARTIFEQGDALEVEAERIAEEAQEDGDDEALKEAELLLGQAMTLKAWGRKSESRRGIEAMIAVARHLRAVHADDLDEDPMLFNCANGTLDLRRRVLRPHLRTDRITKLAPTPFDPNARSEALERFLDDLTCGDRSLRDWLGKLLGYILIGKRTEDVVALFLGAGGSGKSTLFAALVETLGDYAVTVSFDAFLEREHRGGPRPELAMCRGARAVFAAEVSEGVKLDSAVLKSITGGERITARMLYANPITYRPQFVPLLACNVAPLIEADSGNRRRLRIVPCDNEVKDPDKSLREDLGKPEARAALLAFLVDGYKRWSQEGLGTCQAVEDATATYWAGQKQRERERSSKEARATVEVFFGACVEHAEGVVTPSGVLYAGYVEYCTREALEPVADSVFGRVLGAMELPSTRNKTTRSWLGVRLRDFGGEVTDDG